jgi:hypothetical protein
MGFAAFYLVKTQHRPGTKAFADLDVADPLRGISLDLEAPATHRIAAQETLAQNDALGSASAFAEPSSRAVVIVLDTPDCMPAPEVPSGQIFCTAHRIDTSLSRSVAELDTEDQGASLFCLAQDEGRTYGS